MLLCPAELSTDSVADFLQEMERLFSEQAIEEIEVDCSPVERVVSSHINMLWQVKVRCIETGAKIKLLSPSKEMIRVLKVLDLFDLFMGDVAEETHKYIPTSEGPPALTQDKLFELSFRADVKGVDTALESFRDFLRELHISGNSAFELETAFYEVATNIRLHGRLLSEDTVEFKAACRIDMLSMEFVDPGRPFDFEFHRRDFNPREAIKEKKTRGFGLAMVTRMTDNVFYERRDKRLNVLTLEKKWSDVK
jgi:anti-sigma regulatory factor (Ser/Thr protein kinase)/anti-anti-sigma regulatory factor